MNKDYSKNTNLDINANLRKRISDTVKHERASFYESKEFKGKTFMIIPVTGRKLHGNLDKYMNNKDRQDK